MGQKPISVTLLEVLVQFREQAFPQGAQSPGAHRVQDVPDVAGVRLTPKPQGHDLLDQMRPRVVCEQERAGVGETHARLTIRRTCHGLNLRNGLPRVARGRVRQRQRNRATQAM